MSEKRIHESTTFPYSQSEQESVLKRFKGKSIFKWTKESKGEWENSISCTELIPDSPFFVCKQVMSSMMDSDEENPSVWTLDLLCQKWQLRNKDIGMIINLSDHSKYYSDLEEYEDWGITYKEVDFQSKLPTEEELVALLTDIHKFQKENPQLIIGFMSFTVANLPFYIIAQYIGRGTRTPLGKVVLSKHFEKCKLRTTSEGILSYLDLLDEDIRKVLLPQKPSTTLSPTAILSAFEKVTHRQLSLPSHIDMEQPELPPRDALYSWWPDGIHVFLFIVNGIGYIITSAEERNVISGVLPFYLVNTSKKPHNHTLCEGYLVEDAVSMTEKVKTFLLTDLIYVNGMSLRNLPQKQRLGALRKEIVTGTKLSKEEEGKITKELTLLDVRKAVVRECWPKESVESLKTKLIPSLTHACRGMIVIDASAVYEYGDQSVHSWKWS